MSTRWPSCRPTAGPCASGWPTAGWPGRCRRVRAAGCGPARVVRLAADRLDAANTPEAPDRVRVGAGATAPAGDGFARVELPAHSVTVVELTRR